MNTAKKHDWGLIVAGVLLVLCAFFFLVAPGLTLVTITAIAGAAFLVSGVFDIINYARFHKVMNLSGWAIAYAVLDIIIGLMFLVHPLAFAAVIPWVIGAFFLVFGVFEIVGAFRVRKTGIPMWGWMLFSGIVGALCGVTFFVSPASFSIFLSVFILMRGVSLVFYGWNTSKAMI
ncbi:HdeD family acid-resistance protein [Gordonibacter massiliensis (ex Traore et al. 2017)]|uniref:DUF308 domain-containing protein n=1 Tax=Gordonibacter massiliensis (ex Traore et al. 2017) TaxID=1841863 RepID=A0A842JIK6_9ACTN|nr:DUF308 domain-containing protein [Gordonibacter massiliensis (ex Traore et al. 2017)]MBX9035141.1 hypothetical protein [Gordonibacter massiliensis (ex Traore et al. 2017)]